jgi:hypothetical protein
MRFIRPRDYAEANGLAPVYEEPLPRGRPPINAA